MLQYCSVVILCLIVVASSYTNCGSDLIKNVARDNPDFRKGEYINITSNSTANVEKIRDTGRSLRWYYVITCDGYILPVMRLNFEVGKAHNKAYPVLLVHGMYQSSDRFLNQNDGQSLAFALHDLGYDVWLANTRGNKYSRQHLYLEPEADEEKAEFFDHTYEEIAVFDIGAIVDYILNDTRKEKLTYIGHSLGGTLFLVLNSLDPGYNNKFHKAHLLAPLGYQECFPNTKLKDQANQTVYADLLKEGVVEIFPAIGKDKKEDFKPDDCVGNSTYKSICGDLNIQRIMGLKEVNTKDDTRGGSLKILAHFAQNVMSRKFRRWDYGETENEKHYGTKEPPIYNLKLVTVPTEIVYGPNDEYVSMGDTVHMAVNMGNAKTKKIDIPDFKHEDFIDSPDVMEVVYKDIVDDMKNNINKLPSGQTVRMPSHWNMPILIVLLIYLS